jgi:hypothetical protein
MTVPAGAQRSEDGHYWWDGSQWQQVPAGESGPVAAASAAASASPSEGGKPELTEDQFANMMNSAEQGAAEA